MEIGTDWEKYTYEFFLKEDKAGLALKYLMGAAENEDNRLSIDNVVIKIKGAPLQPGEIKANDAYTKAGSDLLINYSGNVTWAQNAVIILNGQAVAKEKVTVDTEKRCFKIDGSLIPKEGKYQRRHLR